MNANISVFVIWVEAIIHSLLYTLHGCTFNHKSVFKKSSGKDDTKKLNDIIITGDTLLNDTHMEKFVLYWIMEL